LNKEKIIQTIKTVHTHTHIHNKIRVYANSQYKVMQSLKAKQDIRQITNNNLKAHNSWKITCYSNFICDG